uniref:Uncharacterized protein n=1 Tax=Kalmanozyma brasiliensis (strain GHG001) TaxID=1365824 RepID=V5ENR6_KALBG
MSDSSFRGMTPVTARSSMVPESVTLTDVSPSRSGGARKIRLRVVTRHPLPEFHFLAPFDHHDSQCFQTLQAFVHTHLLTRSRRSGQSSQLESTGPAALQFQMDNFEVPFDDPEILRDGDTIEVHLDQSAVAGPANSEAPSGGKKAKKKAERFAAALAERGDDEEGQLEEQDDALEKEAQDAEEKEAIFEAARVAALLRAGIHNMADDDAHDMSAQQGAVDDLPRMPGPSFKPLQPPAASKFSSSKAPTSKASNASNAKTTSNAQVPSMPMPVFNAGGAASAMAAFDARRKQMQASSNAKAKGAKRKRAASSSPAESSSDSSSDRSSSSSSSSSSDSESRSDSSSSSDRYSSSDSDSDIDSSDLDSTTSDSSDSSDSAPSEQHTKSDRHRARYQEAAAASTSEQEESSPPVPPGQGMNRTKRRNLMRRKKLQLLRDAGNLQSFEEASKRAAQRERGEHVDDSEGENSSPAWIDDRRPMYQIKGVGIAVVQASNASSSSPTVVSSLPPGAGSLGMAEAEAEAILDQVFGSSESEASKGKKRKRDERLESTADHAPPRRPGPRLEDMQAGQAPYGGDVPAGVSIRHIDCQTYYDDEVAKLETGAEADTGPSLRPDDEREEANASDARQQGKGEGKGQARRSQQKDEGNSQDEVLHLDYGSPDKPDEEQSDQAAPRKRMRTASSEEIAQEGCSCAYVRRSSDEENSDSEALASSYRYSDDPFKSDPPDHWAHVYEGPFVAFTVPKYPTSGPIDPSITWKRIFRGIEPYTIASMQRFDAFDIEWTSVPTGMGVMWEELALNPANMTPAVMYFVGVIDSVQPSEGANEVVHVDAMGPLEKDEGKDWPDYEVKRIRWTEQNHPSQVWMAF